MLSRPSDAPMSNGNELTVSLNSVSVKEHTCNRWLRIKDDEERKQIEARKRLNEEQRLELERQKFKALKQEEIAELIEQIHQILATHTHGKGKLKLNRMKKVIESLVVTEPNPELFKGLLIRCILKTVLPLA